MTGTMKFEDLREEEIGQVVDIVKETRLGFLSRMPRAFIGRYLENATGCARWHCRVLKEEGTVLGFHVTTVGRAVPRNEPLMVTPAYLALIAAVYVMPTIVILNYALAERRIAARHAELRDMYDAELVYIAVHPTHQNRGLGGAFMADIRALCEAHGVALLGTEYYRDDPQAACFYAKHPHEKLGEVNAGGRMSVSLRFDVADLPKVSGGAPENPA